MKWPSVCERIEAVLPARPECVAEGRHIVAEAVRSWGGESSDLAWSDVGHDVLLMASELLTNAVRASRTPITLTLEAHLDHLHVQVRDDSPEPATTGSSKPTDLGGRGVAVVAALAADWGQSAYDGTGKDVWADIASPPGNLFSVRCTSAAT